MIRYAEEPRFGKRGYEMRLRDAVTKERAGGTAAVRVIGLCRSGALGITRLTSEEDDERTRSECAFHLGGADY